MPLRPAHLQFAHSNIPRSKLYRDGIVSKFMDQIASIYEFMILSKIHQFQKYKNDQYLLESWKYIAKSKNGLYYENIRESEALNNAVESEIIQLEEKLSGAIADIKSQLRNCQIDENCKTLTDSLSRIKVQRSNLMFKLQENNEKYYSLKYEFSEMDLNVVQQDLSRNEAIADYYYGDSLVLYIWITKTNINYSIVGKRNVCDSIIYSLVNKVKEQKKIDDILKVDFLDHRLFQSLKTHITIVPDGGLNWFPFDILINSKNQHPLVTNNIISYKYSSNDTYKGSSRHTHSRFNWVGVSSDFNSDEKCYAYLAAEIY